MNFKDRWVEGNPLRYCRFSMLTRYLMKCLATLWLLTTDMSNSNPAIYFFTSVVFVCLWIMQSHCSQMGCGFQSGQILAKFTEVCTLISVVNLVEIPWDTCGGLFFHLKHKDLGSQGIHTFASVVHVDFIIDYHLTITHLLVSDQHTQFSHETCCINLYWSCSAWEPQTTLVSQPSKSLVVFIDPQDGSVISRCLQPVASVSGP